QSSLEFVNPSPVDPKLLVVPRRREAEKDADQPSTDIEDEVAAAPLHDGLVNRDPELRRLVSDRGLGDRAFLVRGEHASRVVVVADNVGSAGRHQRQCGMFEIGGSLREARLKRNFTPADVQKAIRIRDRYLQALEEERWELLPGDAYVKGFLRTYADYLGLDGNLYVEEYNSRFAHPDEPQLVPERFARTPRFGSVGLLRPLVVVG